MMHERLKAERIGSAPVPGTPITDRSSLNYQLERLKSRRRERERELFGEGAEEGTSQPTTPPAAPQSLSTPQKVNVEDMEGAFPSGEEQASRKPVAVSAATLKRRLAMEKREQVAKEAAATPAKNALGKTGAMLRGKLGAGQKLGPPRPPSPPPEAERLKLLEATIQLMQCKGPVAKDILAQALAHEDAGPKGKKSDAPKDSQAFNWICQDRAIQDLNSNFLQRWILRDDVEAERQYQARTGAAAATSSSQTTFLGVEESPQAAKTPSKGTKPPLLQFPPFTAISALDSNQLMRSYRSKILCRCEGEGEVEAPTPSKAPGHGSPRDQKDVKMLRSAFPELTLSPQGEQCYTPCEREIQLLWLNMTPIIRAISSCMDNGRSNVSKAAVETLGALLNCTGCMRLQALFPSSDTTNLEALRAQPSYRGLETQADAILSKLIIKGGTASVKFLYDTCGLGLLCGIRALGATNAVLTTTLLTSIAQNPPKTEKSRVLWADSIAFALMLRWSYLRTSHAIKTGSPSDAVKLMSLATHVLGSLDCVAGGQVSPGSTLNSSETKRPLSPRRLLRAAVLDKGSPSVDESPQPPTTNKDMKDIATKLAMVADILLADGSPEVRESAKRVLFGYVLLAEEHARIYGYASSSDSMAAASPSSPAKGKQQSLDDTVPGSFLVPPTVESVARRSFLDKKSKLERILETMRLVRQVYCDQFVTSVLKKTNAEADSSGSSTNSQTQEQHLVVEVTPASPSKKPVDFASKTPQKSSTKPPRSPARTPTRAPPPAVAATMAEESAAIPHQPHTPSASKGAKRPGRKVSDPQTTTPATPQYKATPRSASASSIESGAGREGAKPTSAAEAPKETPQPAVEAQSAASEIPAIKKPGGPHEKKAKGKLAEQLLAGGDHRASKLFVQPARFSDSLPPSVCRSDAELLFRSGVFVGAASSSSSRDSSRAGAPASTFVPVQMGGLSYAAWEKAFLAARVAIRSDDILFLPELAAVNTDLMAKAAAEERTQIKEGESELYYHNNPSKSVNNEEGNISVSSSFSVTSLARRWSAGGASPKGLSVENVDGEDSGRTRPEELLTLKDIVRCVAALSHVSSSTILSNTATLNSTVTTASGRQECRDAALEFLRLAFLCPGLEVSSHEAHPFLPLPASLPYEVSLALLDALLHRCSSESRGSRAQLCSLFILHTLLDDIKRAKITVLDGWTSFAPSAVAGGGRGKERRRSVAPLTTALGYSLSKPALDALSSKAVGALTTAISNTRAHAPRGKAAAVAGPASAVACEGLSIFLSVLNRFVYESAEEARLRLVFGNPEDLRSAQSLSLTTAKTLLNSVSMTASSSRCWPAKAVMLNAMKELTILFLAAEKRSVSGQGSSPAQGRIHHESDKTNALLGDSDGTFMIATSLKHAKLIPISPMPITSPFLSAVDVTRAFDTAVRVCAQALELLSKGCEGEDADVLVSSAVAGLSYMKAAFVCRQEQQVDSGNASPKSPGATKIGSSSLLTAKYASDLWKLNIAVYLVPKSPDLDDQGYEEDFEDADDRSVSAVDAQPIPGHILTELLDKLEKEEGRSRSKRSRAKPEECERRLFDLVFCVE